MELSMFIIITSVLLLIAVFPCSCKNDGLAKSPPMGYRTWNTYKAAVTSDLLRKLADEMTIKRDSNGEITTGNGMSFADLGYKDLGLDDNWQDCGKGVGNSFHDKDGKPIVNSKFSDMADMVRYIHNKGLTAGFYLNNCICAEKNTSLWKSPLDHYLGDVEATVEFGFDSVKLDGCGSFLNLSLYSDLFDKRASMLIENCHWGNDAPTATDCPFHFFRTSGDIQASFESMFHNLQTVTPFQDVETPISRPGCWAYPDMMEVGNLKTFEEDRTHFGAWCITSSPLIMGHNLTNPLENKKVWSILSNLEAIRINQDWAGHPGRLLKTFGKAQVWIKPLSGGDIAVLLLNGEAFEYKFALSWADFGLKTSPASILDVWSGQELEASTSWTVKSHDSMFFRFIDSDKNLAEVM